MGKRTKKAKRILSYTPARKRETGRFILPAKVAKAVEARLAAAKAFAEAAVTVEEWIANETEVLAREIAARKAAARAK